jgi:hypothetical protein
MAEENKSRLKAAGPIDPEDGFPLWFEDTNGVRLELGLNPDPRTPAIGDLPQPGAPLKFPENFPDESFYFLAEARLPVGGNGVVGRARVIFALEAAFGGAGTPKAGLNVVFARIRVRMDDLIPGEAYAVTHPYGTIDPKDLTADENGRVFYTEDLGIVEGDGTAVLRSGQVAPFLIGTSPLPAPDGNYIGDGATEQQVTGSPFSTNFVMIEGSNIREGGGNPDPSDPSNLDRVWTDRFTVQGRKANRVGAWVDGTTYAQSTDGSGRSLLSVQARSIAGQDLRLVATGVHFKLDSEGEFYTGLGQATTLPSDARLVNVSDSPPTSYPVTFTDLVLVESALYDLATKTLTIQARSSDPTNALLTLPQLNDLPLTSNPQSFNRDAVPSDIIVQSSLGGKGRQRLEVVGIPKVNLPVEAIIAPPPPGAIAGEQVTLDGSGSLGATIFTWSQTAGSTVILTGANTAKVTFTPPTAESYTFNLTVQGNDGSSDNIDITISVKPTPGPDTLTMTRQEYRTSARQFRIEGTVDVSQVPNEIVVTFRGQELGRSMADITGAWSVRRTLFASQTILVPTVGDTVQVSSRRGSVNPPPVIRIRN